MGEAKFKKINLVIDTVNDSMWSALSAPIFKRYVGKLAVHVGTVLGEYRDEWLTRLDTERFPWIQQVKLEGKPRWKPNAYIFDLGRRIDFVRIDRIPGVPAVVCFADDHQHHFGSKMHSKMPKRFISYSNQFDLIFLRQHCALEFYDQEKVRWFPHSSWSHTNCACAKVLKKTKPIYDVVFPGRIVEKSKNIYASGDAYGAQRMKLAQSLLKYNIRYSESKLPQCQYQQMIRQGKIVFNCTGTPYDLNKRVFETLAANRLLLTNNNSHYSGVLKLFEHKKHLVVYNDEKELHEYVEYYLKHDDERLQIAQNGYDELMKNHTEDARVIQILNELLLTDKRKR